MKSHGLLRYFPHAEPSREKKDAHRGTAWRVREPPGWKAAYKGGLSDVPFRVPCYRLALSSKFESYHPPRDTPKGCMGIVLAEPASDELA